MQCITKLLKDIIGIECIVIERSLQFIFYQFILLFYYYQFYFFICIILLFYYLSIVFEQFYQIQNVKTVKTSYYSLETDRQFKRYLKLKLLSIDQYPTLYSIQSRHSTGTIRHSNAKHWHSKTQYTHCLPFYLFTFLPFYLFTFYKEYINPAFSSCLA